jgi:hypothetical protein
MGLVPPPGTDLCGVSDVPIGTGRLFGRVIVVRSVEGIFGYENLCPHESITLNLQKIHFMRSSLRALSIRRRHQRRWRLRGRGTPADPARDRGRPYRYRYADGINSSLCHPELVEGLSRFSSSARTKAESEPPDSGRAGAYRGNFKGRSYGKSRRFSHTLHSGCPYDL